MFGILEHTASGYEIWRKLMMMGLLQHPCNICDFVDALDAHESNDERTKTSDSQPTCM